MEKQRRPLIVAMKGHPGTGKSTLARAICAALRCPLLDKDDVRDCTLPVQAALAGAGAGDGDATTAGGASCAAAALLNDLSYAVLWRVADTQLGLGLPALVVDSPLSRRAHLDRLVELAARHGGRVAVVECRPADEAEWRRRLEERGAAAEADADGWHKPRTWEDLRRLVEGYGGCTEYDSGDVARFVVDTTTSASTAAGVDEVLEFLRLNAADN